WHSTGPNATGQHLGAAPEVSVMLQSTICDCSNLTALLRGAFGSGLLRVQTPTAEGCCPICLETIRKTAYTYTCCHAFCFSCIRRWAATSSTCPLCRQPINRILHTVGSSAPSLSLPTTPAWTGLLIWLRLGRPCLGSR
uniref:RING-type E3 ubiquitin transferase n=1 Tax=Cairina moschata TaxID=8855 RepID=A0A8C3C4Z3_CAIMO